MERFFRYFYFFVMPFVLVVASLIFPMVGVLINVVLSTLIFLLAERIAEIRLGKMPLSKLFGKQLKFKAYYEENPPKSFGYYALYPLILPYILWNPKARQEFLLYRGYALLNLVLLVVNNTIQYFRFWWPQIPVGKFIPIVIAWLVLEALLIAMLVVPISTTIVTYKLRGEEKRLWSFLVVGLISIVMGVIGVSKARTQKPLWMVTERAKIRENVLPEKAIEVKKGALQKAKDVLRQNPQDLLPDGFIVGTTREQARHELERLFLPDEARVFYLWSSPAPAVLVLFSTQGGGVGTWLGLSASGEWLTVPAELPENALQAMKNTLK